ncbi:hypothetical protein L1077_22595 [Pseudoalteromonas luteoviolacea]|uniref:Uncharacterized protein n=1 Tax=Pseudoalteromonas luteoviolacea H33 TaxID=1365251 RepID=A0A167EDA4_9GAMM|nr:hypothetical protein [Pseudoalteromonas luteoviolacea]KZN50423.1 hypothetical protein N476_16380 [Pseudoalteromonas luteoviolacea H33]KZN77928.1 hypothetical protein N477_11085 [Pseudoalteromonas luteoviolacea H33-S]MBQ4879488.1 hypothetical protein [Pseudoalteromonas luteoviolacea]MBQ4908585.1 hypothetical protein [Pseudoalteromonas luteoviolacea]MCF6442217.1 hypothetical protein [Pseudoalteromonas luteoviolacea]
MKLSLQKKKLKTLSKSQSVMTEQTPNVAGGAAFNTTRPGSTCQNTTACPSRDRPDTCKTISREISCLIGHSCLC